MVDPAVCWGKVEEPVRLQQYRKTHAASSRAYDPSEGGRFLYFHIPSGNEDFVPQLAGIGDPWLGMEHMLSALHAWVLWIAVVTSIAYRNEMSTLSELIFLLTEEVGFGMRKSKREGEILMV